MIFINRNSANSVYFVLFECAVADCTNATSKILYINFIKRFIKVHDWLTYAEVCHATIKCVLIKLIQKKLSFQNRKL